MRCLPFQSYKHRILEAMNPQPGQVTADLGCGLGFDVLRLALTAVAMGIRNAFVCKLAVPDLTTTVLTLTITGLAADSALAGGQNPLWPRRLTAVFAMLAGATLGALLLRHSVVLPLFVGGSVIVGCALTTARHGTSHEKR